MGLVSGAVCVTHGATNPQDVKAPARAALPPSPNSGTEADLATVSTPSDNSNPYAIIVDRNVFRLVPPPPPPAPEKPPIDVPQVNLSGFRKTAKDVWVYLAMKPKDPKDSWQYFSMKEGDKAGKEPNTLELVKIHPGEDAVDIINSGQAMSLTLKSNSFASAGASTPGPGGGGKPGDNIARRRMGVPPPAPAQSPATSYTPAMKTGPTAIGLSSDSTGVVAGAQPIPQAAGYNPTASYGAQNQYYGGNTTVAGAQPIGISTPNGTTELNPSVPSRGQAQANWPPVQQASLEQQVAGMAAHEAAGGPPMPPIPGVNAPEEQNGGVQPIPYGRR